MHMLRVFVFSWSLFLRF